MNEEIKITVTDTDPMAVKKESEPLTVAHAIIWNAVIIAAAIVCASLIVVQSLSPKTAANPAANQNQQAAAATPDIKNVKLSGQPYIGSPSAPVVLAYWSDYQCPFCKQFETNTLPTIIKNYVATGKVAVVFKDFSFLGPDSNTAALYARAIDELYPQQYFAWREAMFASQDAENSGFGDEASIVKLTATISGIDAAKVQAQVAAKKTIYQQEIDADRAEAASFGISGTPSFITGTKLIPGVAPYSTFAAAFDAQLKK